MKRKILSIILATTVSYSAFAEKSGTVSATMPNTTEPLGLRIALVKPFFNLKAKSKVAGQTFTIKDNLENEAGLSLGYAYLPTQQLGFTTNIAYLNLGAEDEELNEKENVGFVRVDGNLAYTITDNFNIKGGLNIGKFTNKDPKNFNPELGFQVGVGYQITKNFGADLSFVQMNQSEKFEDVKVTITEQGLELGVHATF